MSVRPYLLVACAAVSIIVIVLCHAGAADAQGVDPSFAPLLQDFGDTQNRPAIRVSTLQPDGKLLVGGIFTVAGGLARSGVVRYNPDGTPDATFDAGDIGVGETILSTTTGGTIEAIKVQQDGKILIGGLIRREVDLPTRAIEGLNPDGSRDTSFNPPPGFPTLGGVSDIEIQSDGKIVVGGGFEYAAPDPATGQTVNFRYLARFNPDGSLDFGFRPNALQNSNNLVIQPDGKIVVANASTNSDIFQLIRFNSDGTRDAVLTNFDDWVTALELLPDGRFVVTGYFRFVNDEFQKFLVRLSPNGIRDAGFNNTLSFVNDLSFQDVTVQPDGKIIVGGGFSTIDSFTRWRVARFNADGSMDSTFATSTPIAGTVGEVQLLQDGRVFIGGAFPRPSNSEFYANMGRLNADGSYDGTYAGYAVFEGEGYTIVQQPDGKILIGGFIYYAENQRRRGLVRYNADGTLDAGFVPYANLSYVLDIALQPDGKIIVVNSDSPSSLFRLNPDGSLDPSFVSPFVSFSASIQKRTRITSVVLQPDGKLLVGGQLITGSATSPSLSGLARLNPNGSTDWLVAALGGTRDVHDIVLQPDGRIVIGGDFTRINNDSSFAYLARVNANGTPDASFRPPPPPSPIAVIYEIERQSDGKIVYAGNFNYVLRVDAAGNADPSFAVPVNDQVEALTVQRDDKLLVGGYFRSIGGADRRRIARLNANGSVDGFYPHGGANNVVYDLYVQADVRVLVAGAFTKIGGAERIGAARLFSSASRNTSYDFDGDGKTDIGIFRPAGGEWWYRRSSDGSVPAGRFGEGTDKIAPVDFTGDGKADVAFWRPSTGFWYILRSEDGSYYSVPFGAEGDIPVPADYDADGKADTAVFRPSTNTWYIQNSGGGTTITTFGISGDLPVVADYDGDRRADIAVYRPGTGVWWINRSTAGLVAFQFGSATDKPVQGDYSGDGKADAAFWRPSTGQWFVVRSEDSSFYSVPFGASGDVPAAGDYDGDGKWDTTVFRPTGSTWYIQGTTAGTQIVPFGAPADRPVANAFVP